MAKKPLSKLVTRTYGVADLFQSTMNNTANYMFVFVLTNVFLFSNETTLMISGVSSTIIAALTFVIGPIISGTPAMRWGRHRSFMLVFAPLAALGFVLKFTRLFEAEYAAAIAIIIANVGGSFCGSLVSGSHAALVNIFTDDPKERGKLASHRGTAIGVASVITSYTTVPLVDWLKNYVSDQVAYSVMAIIVVACYLGTMYYTVWLSKGYEGAGADSDSKSEKRHARTPLRVMLISFIKNSNLIALVGADIARFTANMTILGTAAYFFTYVVKDYSMMAVYTLFGGIIQAFGSFVSGLLTRYSSKQKLVVSEFGAAICCLLIYLVGGSSIALSLALMLLYRFMHGIGFSMYFALYTDSVVFSEWKTGAFIPGFNSSMYSVSAQMGSMLKGWILPALLIAINFVADTPVEQVQASTLQGLMLVFTLFPGALRALSGLIITLFYKLTPARLDEYRKEIAARKSATN